MNSIVSKSQPSSRVVAIIPAFNEAGNIASVVSELRGLGETPDVVVIDDGSHDETAAVARRAGAIVLQMPFNSGIGATVQAGLTYAVRGAYDLVTRFDGDGQHDPAALAQLRAPIDEGRADFVLGSRYIARTGFQSTWLRRLGSWWFSFILRPILGQHISDPTSGCWAANRHAAAVLNGDYSADYPEVDSLVRLARSGCRIVEIPVTMRHREAGRSSIEGFKVPYYMFKVTLAVIMAWVRSDAVPRRSAFPDPGSRDRLAAPEIAHEALSSNRSVDVTVQRGPRH